MMTSADKKVSSCEKCAGEILPGTLFCWRHGARSAAAIGSLPPKIAELAADAGQLLWRTTDKASAKLERCFAVLLDGQQVAVRDAEEAPSGSPERVEMTITTGDAAKNDVRIFVRLTDVLVAANEGAEILEAARFA